MQLMEQAMNHAGAYTTQAIHRGAVCHTNTDWLGHTPSVRTRGWQHDMIALMVWQRPPLAWPPLTSATVLNSHCRQVASSDIAAPVTPPSSPRSAAPDSTA